MSELTLPGLYAIADVQLLAASNIALVDFARELRDGGVAILQYRDKTRSPQEILRAAATLREVFAGSGAKLIMNDRADLATLSSFDGVHVGQEDLSPEDARTLISAEHIIGVSTHSDAQVRAADTSCADYIAIGPIFPTGTKENPSPVVGLDGVRRARALTGKPLVAIGGITRKNARSVIDAGADSIAVISALIAPGETVEQVARDFLNVLR